VVGKTVRRLVTSWTKKEGLKQRLVDQPAGFMVYFPRGHCLRLKDKESLRKYGLDRQPTIINLDGLNDPNSILGKLVTAQDEASRHDAYADMEKYVIQLATAKTGSVVLPEQVAAMRQDEEAA
jgi:hypothetical protein